MYHDGYCLTNQKQILEVYDERYSNRRGRKSEAMLYIVEGLDKIFNYPSKHRPADLKSLAEILPEKETV